MTLKRGESRYKGAWQTFEHASAIDVSCHIDRENQQLVCLGVALDFRAKMHGLRSMSCQDVTWRAKWNFGFCLAFRMLSEDCNSVSLDRKPGRRCDLRSDHKRVRILFVRARPFGQRCAVFRRHVNCNSDISRTRRFSTRERQHQVFTIRRRPVHYLGKFSSRRRRRRWRRW